MKILVAHNRYQLAGGEDAVVRDEVALLRRHGHNVELLEDDNDGIQGIQGNLIAAASIFYSAGSRRRMRQAISEFQPDVVHIHNWFPMLSPSIFMEADRRAVPIVETLHNFRMICAGALLYRNGRVCLECVGRSLPVGGIVHGCYRGSRLGSAVVTAAFAFHRLAQTWDGVDLFIAVSEFEREILVRGGLPAEKVVVKQNFVASDNYIPHGKRDESALFVGRLSPEKGVRTLLSAWNSEKIPFALKVIGDGPMADEVRSSAALNSRVEYLGAQTQEAVYREMAKARFLVFPSQWYETFGRTIVEAFAQGTPVLAADLGGVPELVEEGETGHRFAPGDVDALIAGANGFASGARYERMQSNCRNLYLSKFTAEINYAGLMGIYSRAMAARKLRP